MCLGARGGDSYPERYREGSSGAGESGAGSSWLGGAGWGPRGGVGFGWAAPVWVREAGALGLVLERCF